MRSIKEVGEIQTRSSVCLLESRGRVRKLEKGIDFKEGKGKNWKQGEGVRT